MTVYLRITDKKKKAWVSSHQVWDADKFIAAQRERHAKEKGTVAVIDEAEYHAEKWADAPGKGVK